MSGLEVWEFLAFDVLIFAVCAVVMWSVLRGPMGGGRR